MKQAPTHRVGVAANTPRPAESFDGALSVLGDVNRKTITLHLPLLHNPGRLGIRLPIGPYKFLQTFRELKSQFSGFNVSPGLGWCTEDGVWDLYLRVNFDEEMTPELEQYLVLWREVLRIRFVQRSIHMTVSSPVKWISQDLLTGRDCTDLERHSLSTKLTTAL